MRNIGYVLLAVGLVLSTGCNTLPKLRSKLQKSNQ